MVAIEFSIGDDYKSLLWTCIIVTSKLAFPYVHNVHVVLGILAQLTPYKLSFSLSDHGKGIIRN